VSTVVDGARKVREAWTAFAVWVGYGICDSCGRPAHLARQPRCRKRECIECFEFGPPERRRA
jgi:hypothetical protein